MTAEGAGIKENEIHVKSENLTKTASILQVVQVQKLKVTNQRKVKRRKSSSNVKSVIAKLGKKQL